MALALFRVGLLTLTGLTTLAVRADAENVITKDSFFYGESPPVYPSRKLQQPLLAAARADLERYQPTLRA